MLNYEFPPLGGGAANACYYLLKEFASQKDITIDVITSGRTQKIEQFSKNITIHYIKINKKNPHYWKMSEILVWTLKAYKLSHAFVRKKKYDVCHCWFGWPSGMIGYTLGIPYIVALRGSDVPGYNPRLSLLDSIIFKPISKVVWGKASHVVANSAGLRDLALKTARMKIDIIYNGVDVHEFKPSVKKNKKLK